jgi:hypothetical protein
MWAGPEHLPLRVHIAADDPKQLLMLTQRESLQPARSSYAPDVKTEAISGRHDGAREYRYIHFA